MKYINDDFIAILSWWQKVFAIRNFGAEPDWAPNVVVSPLNAWYKTNKAWWLPICTWLSIIIFYLPHPLPEIKEGNHCSCAKYKAEIHVWHLIRISKSKHLECLLMSINLHNLISKHKHMASSFLSGNDNDYDVWQCFHFTSRIDSLSVSLCKFPLHPLH